MKKYGCILLVLVFSLIRPLWADDTDLFTTGAHPNILIILDNSNSVDEDFWGNAVGSFASTSKTVIGKKALKNVIDTFNDKLRFGLMTYRLSGASGSNLHNSPYFVSYEPKSYCPNPPPQCVAYAQTLDAGAKATCSTQCKIANPLFDADYLDEIITNYAVGSEQRNRYSNLVYPKAQRMPNPNDPGKYVYYKHAYPYYSGNNDGIGYCYSSGYNSAEGGPWDSYACYRTKTGTSDGDSGYATNFLNAQFQPTDSDYALGYADFGKRLTFYYAGPTWHSNSSPGDGYLHVAIGDLLDDKGKTTATYTSLISQLDPKENDPAGYMSCGAGDKNTCSYVINAGLTPTAGTVGTALKYFKGEGYTSPIQNWCQKNFIIYVTDGLPSVDDKGAPKNADELMPTVLTNIDALRKIAVTVGKDSYNFDVKTYVLGVGLSSEAKLKLDDMANHGGTADANGHAYYADDPTQLNDALTAIFNEVISKAYSFASPTIPSVRMVEGDVVYISSFTPQQDKPFWPGYLSAYQLNPDGTLPVDLNGEPSQSSVWTASIPKSRTINTVVGGVLQDFTSDKLTKDDLGVKNNGERDALISYVRGLGLGDIIHSNSVIVGSPSPYFQDRGFSTKQDGSVCVDKGDCFYGKNKDRQKVVIVGANDGMLHAFNATTGVEAWAFIPNNLLKNLKLMQKDHTYYVDSSPKVADVWFYSDLKDTTKSVDEWRTVLVCGLRKGGKTYFALDITKTQNPEYLWEFPKPGDDVTLAKMGESWVEPAIGRVKIEKDGDLHERWVAFIGGGFDSTDGKTGSSFFVIDIKTGNIIWEFSYDSKDALKKQMTHSLVAPPTAVDLTLDGYIDKVYIGDLGGQMWGFDVSFDQTTKKSDSLWQSKASLLFKAPKANDEKHKIYYQPAVVFDKNKIPWVYFGTGDRNDPKESNNPQERFYAVMDDGLGNYPRQEPKLGKDDGDIKDVTGGADTFAPDLTKKGWFIRLDKEGKTLEKVLAKPAIFNQLIYFTTYSYTEKTKDPCAVSGFAREYIVGYLSGGAALNVDDMIDLSKPPSGDRSRDIGTGAPSAPVISVSKEGKASVTIGMTSDQFHSKKALSLPVNKGLLYWREVIPAP